MVEIRWTRQASVDITEIAEYIEQESAYYASLQVTRFYESISVLEKQMHIGKPVPELHDENVRELLVGSYRIIYLILSETRIDIISVIHGKRLLANHPTFKKKDPT
jgi:toxin ParE1/3/4